MRRRASPPATGSKWSVGAVVGGGRIRARAAERKMAGMNAPAEPAALADPLVIAGRAYRSRLLVGTGKYRDFAQTREAIVASGAQIVTVAIRRTNIGQDANAPSLLDALPPSEFTYLPNTRRLLHGRRRGAHAEARARAARRPRADQARSAGRREHAVSRTCARR